MIGGYSVGAKVTGCAAAVSLGALTYYGFNLGHHAGRAIDRVTFWPLVVKERIAATYSYLFQSLVITGMNKVQNPRLASLKLTNHKLCENVT